MRTFDSFFRKNTIIRYLCRQRAKLAKKRSKDHILSEISSNKRYDYHKGVKRQNQKKEICIVMPPRRLWINPIQTKRNGINGKLNSIDKNKLAIFLTIKKHISENIKYRYIEKLEHFMDGILKDINSKSFKFESPRIRPEFKEKKDGKYVYRPISSFSLRDNLINCFTNRYLVRYFDELFYKNSFAFRAGRTINNEHKVPSHHDAFRKIIDYLKENSDKKIFVAECDMQKFYDSVSHKIVLRQFRKLCFRKLLRERCDKRAKKIFIGYLKSYNFFDCVYKLNGNKEYFKKQKVIPGEFEWVEKEIRRIYNDKEITDIGIPQGGALSGLIANIVLDYADKNILQLKDKDLLYVRYCDDMIMVHTDEKKCDIALQKYIASLKKLRLFPHPTTHEPYSKKFWSSKTKSPYEWSEENVPWVGFVGYEINRSGKIRVRKKSIRKEKDKQKKLIDDVITAISKNNLKVSKNTVVESTVNRLIGMAVGRVKLWNYENYKNDMCWAKGFNLLNDNKYSCMQVKSLDRSRNKNLRRLYKALDKIDDSGIKAKIKKTNKQNIFYGKPFSYFYQVIEKNSKKEI